MKAQLSMLEIVMFVATATFVLGMSRLILSSSLAHVGAIEKATDISDKVAYCRELGMLGVPVSGVPVQIALDAMHDNATGTGTDVIPRGKITYLIKQFTGMDDNEINAGECSFYFLGKLITWRGAEQ